MNHERLAELIRAQREAIAVQPEAWATHGTILGILTALEKGEVTESRAVYLLRNQATHLADEPTHAALSRQAAADIRQMQREEH